MTQKFPVSEVVSFVNSILVRKGLRNDLAKCTAEVLVESDLLGHRTHGLALLKTYIEKIDEGSMSTDGEISILSDFGSAFSWDGNKLPGAFVLKRAMEEAIARTNEYPVVTATISECFHIGCLQAYLFPAIENGMMAIITATDPESRSVAPYGGTKGVLTTNPIAFGIPTMGDPILVDICTSLVSNAAVRQHQANGTRFSSNCLLSSEGVPTNDPNVLNTTPPGTILPIGGAEYGYKGFALGLFVEATALALSGYNRTVKHELFREGVFLQLINPEKFAGGGSFQQAMTALSDECRASGVAVAGSPSVRMPGERALELRKEQLMHGLDLPPNVVDELSRCGNALGIELPRPSFI
jgi:L-lactate dehydrogenase